MTAKVLNEMLFILYVNQVILLLLLLVAQRFCSHAIIVIVPFNHHLPFCHISFSLWLKRYVSHVWRTYMSPVPPPSPLMLFFRNSIPVWRLLFSLCTKKSLLARFPCTQFTRILCSADDSYRNGVSSGIDAIRNAILAHNQTQTH